MRILIFGAGLLYFYQVLRLRRKNQLRYSKMSPKLLSDQRSGRKDHVIYRVVPHDGGWAYWVNGVFSETFPTRKSARLAARRASIAHESSGRSAAIEYQDEQGYWHQEYDRGDDRPETEIRDYPDSKAAKDLQ